MNNFFFSTIKINKYTIKIINKYIKFNLRYIFYLFFFMLSFTFEACNNNNSNINVLSET